MSVGSGYGTYAATSTPNIGTAATDAIRLEFYGPSFNPSFNGESKGTFNLASGADANYGTCSRCVLVLEDAAAATGRTFFQQSGTLVVDATSDQLYGEISGTLTDVTLIEVTLAPMTYMSTPVPNGACVHIASAPVSVVAPVVPPGWMCNPGYYGDSACDCGCGVVDLDCPNALATSCQFCDDPNSCNAGVGDCPGSINANNNAICTP